MIPLDRGLENSAQRGLLEGAEVVAMMKTKLPSSHSWIRQHRADALALLQRQEITMGLPATRGCMRAA